MSQNAIIKQALVQTIINVALGSVPYLLNKHAYFLPLSWIAIGSIGKGIAMQIQAKDKNAVKSIRERFRRKLFANGSFFETFQETGVALIVDESTMPSADKRNNLENEGFNAEFSSSKPGTFFNSGPKPETNTNPNDLNSKSIHE